MCCIQLYVDQGLVCDHCQEYQLLLDSVKAEIIDQALLSVLEIEDAYLSKKAGLSDVALSLTSSLWHDPLTYLSRHESLVIVVRSVVQLISLLPRLTHKVLTFARRLDIQIRLVSDKDHKIVKAFDFNAVITSGLLCIKTASDERVSTSVLDVEIDSHSNISVIADCRFRLSQVNALSFNIRIASAPGCDDPVRLLASVSHSWCCLVAERINSRLRKHDDASDEFRLLSLLDTEISDDGRLHLTYSITFACLRSNLKPRLRQMLKVCARFLIAPSTSVRSLTGSTSIGLIALNLLEGDVYRVVAQPTGSLIDQCGIMRRDCLNILRLAAPPADMSLTFVVHCQTRTFGNSLFCSVTRLTCLRSIESSGIKRYRHC